MLRRALLQLLPVSLLGFFIKSREALPEPIEEPKEEPDTEKFLIVCGAVIPGGYAQRNTGRIAEFPEADSIPKNSRGGIWFTNYPDIKDEPANMWPRSSSFPCQHEIMIGTIDEIVNWFRLSLQLSIDRYREGASYNPNDHKVLAKNDGIIATSTGANLMPITRYAGDPIIKAFYDRRKELDPDYVVPVC